MNFETTKFELMPSRRNFVNNNEFEQSPEQHKLIVFSKRATQLAENISGAIREYEPGGATSRANFTKNPVSFFIYVVLPSTIIVHALTENKKTG
jgi:hypothetical protein